MIITTSIPAARLGERGGHISADGIDEPDQAGEPEGDGGGIVGESALRLGGGHAQNAQALFGIPLDHGL